MRRGMNERIQKLREQSVNAVPHIYMERADLETDAYIKYEGSVRKGTARSRHRHSQNFAVIHWRTCM